MFTTDTLSVPSGGCYMEELILERLAELEHKQWVKWSQNIVSTENISIERKFRWVKLWKPYSELTEEEKEQDRVWARKVLGVLKNANN
jgi:hypothetical protein